MKRLFLILLILFFFSCNKKEKTSDKIHLITAEEILFRRNYFYPDTISDKERDELDKRNPERIDNPTKQSKFYLGLKKMNLFDVNDGSLIEKIWNTFTEKAEQKGKIKIDNVVYQYTIKLKEQDSCIFNLTDKRNQIVFTKQLDFGHSQGLGFLIKDLDEDGTDEIISFYHWYIVNGDNYDIQIYRIGKQ